MKCLWSILFISILPPQSLEVELNMQGSVNLGKDVVEALSRYIEIKKKSARRSFTSLDENGAHTVGLEPQRHSVVKVPQNTPNTIPKIVHSADLCQDLEFCKGDLGTLVNKYIVALTEDIELVFKSLVNDINNAEDNTQQIIIFEDELKEILKDLKKLIKKADAKVKDLGKAYAWVNLIKKINAECLDRAMYFASQRLEGSKDEIAEVKKNLTQKLVIAATLVELKFEKILCSQHAVCAKTYEVTKSLNSLLGHLKTVNKDILKQFFKDFIAALSVTNFYKTLSNTTAHEFQSILIDMSETDTVLNQNIVAAVHKSVEERRDMIDSKFKREYSKCGKDVKLVYIILSDMDFLYNEEDAESFRDFFEDFYEWIKNGGSLEKPIRRLMKDIQRKLTSGPKDVVMKLISEVKVFMEITIEQAP